MLNNAWFEARIPTRDLARAWFRDCEGNMLGIAEIVR
jgi:hypothetical protein